MDIRHITDTFSVSPQIGPDDLSALRERGFRSIVCTRPDGEQDGQPTFAAVAAEAAKLGLQARYIPIKGAPVAPADVEAFRTALVELPQPMLAYCRSGTRAAVLWSLVYTGKLPMQDILTLTHDAGYDVAQAIHLSLPEKGIEDDAPSSRTGTR